MKITLEMIDELRERKNVSYSDAKEALEHADGEMVDAIIFLERNKTVNDTNNEKEKFSNKVKKFVDRVCEIKIDVKKEEKLELRLPLIIFLILFFPMLPAFIIGAGLYLILGYKIKVENGDEEGEKINEVLNKASEAMKGEK